MSCSWCAHIWICIYICRFVRRCIAYRQIYITITCAGKIDFNYSVKRAKMVWYRGVLAHQTQNTRRLTQYAVVAISTCNIEHNDNVFNLYTHMLSLSLSLSLAQIMHPSLFYPLIWSRLYCSFYIFQTSLRVVVGVLYSLMTYIHNNTCIYVLSTYVICAVYTHVLHQWYLGVIWCWGWVIIAANDAARSHRHNVN